MSHPFNEHRQHHAQHKRVRHLTGHHGTTHDGSSRAIHKSVHKAAIKRKSGGRVEGKEAKHRQDKPHRAKGGRVHKGKTNINIVVGHPSSPSPMPTPMPAAAPPPMPPRPAPPPMAGPPGMPPGMPAGPMPGGLPGGIRSAGGRAYKRGGAVKDGPAWNEGRRNGTQVQHSDGKNDGKNIGRGKPVTYKTGGAVEHPQHGGMAPSLPGGSGGGEARLKKRHMGSRAMRP